MKSEEAGGGNSGLRVTLGLAALCEVLHLFGDVVHVGDVRPLLRVGVDAHIYQVPQLVGGVGGEGKERDNIVNDTILRCNEEQLHKSTNIC